MQAVSMQNDYALNNALEQNVGNDADRFNEHAQFDREQDCNFENVESGIDHGNYSDEDDYIRSFLPNYSAADLLSLDNCGQVSQSDQQGGQIWTSLLGLI
jgi:hypothetical protein